MMFKIVKKKVLNSQVKLMEIDAPYIAKKAEPGQFIIFRINENSERVPLTIADFNREKGTITIIFQEVGKTTKNLGLLNEGDTLLDFVGPLGVPTKLGVVKKAVIIGGGLGSAIAYPQAKKLSSLGTEVDSIIGFRNKDFIVLEKELETVSNRLFVTTDDGSNGTKGFVTDILERLIKEGNQYDIALAMGPLVMMKAVSSLTKQYNIKTIVSLNPIMVDGTGMCGGCRVTVGGETKFACVDGPDFDGHKVDFDEAIRRQSMYKKHEMKAADKHKCRLGGDQHA